MLEIQNGAGRDGEALSKTAGTLTGLRRRDRLLPAMVERQKRSGVARSARNILAKHHHAVADVASAAAHDLAVTASRRRSDTDDRNIARIRATQEDGRASAPLSATSRTTSRGAVPMPLPERRTI